MYYSEMKQAVKLLANEWNLGKKECGATGNICAWIYLFTVLEESEKIVTCKDGRKLIGFSGYSKDNSKKHLLKKKFYTIMKNKLYKSKDIKDFACDTALEEIYRDNKYIYYLPCIKSTYIKVIYAPNNYQEGLKVSLEERRIKINDLDRFNIEYIKQEI